jgi:predicted DNA binding CopG/RHH family protein
MDSTRTAQTALNMRIPAALLEAVKAKAASQGVPCACYVRMRLEADISRSPPYPKPCA